MKKVMQYPAYILTLSSLISLTACSTMFGDNDREVHIQAPAGATVSVGNVVLEEGAPTSTQITDMWTSTQITVSSPGCPKQTVTINPEFQPIGLLNILVFPGFIVDAVTGDMMKIPDDQRNLYLDSC